MTQQRKQMLKDLMKILPKENKYAAYDKSCEILSAHYAECDKKLRFGCDIRELAIKNSIITVDYILQAVTPEHYDVDLYSSPEVSFWKEVKQEIEKL